MWAFDPEMVHPTWEYSGTRRIRNMLRSRGLLRSQETVPWGWYSPGFSIEQKPYPVNLNSTMLLLMWHWDKPASGFPRPGCWSVPHYQVSHDLAVDRCLTTRFLIAKKEGRRPGIFYHVNDVNVYLGIQRRGGGVPGQKNELEAFSSCVFPSVEFQKCTKQKTYCLVFRTKTACTKCVHLIRDNNSTHSTKLLLAYVAGAQKASL